MNELSTKDLDKLELAFRSAFEKYFQDATKENIYKDFGPSE